jgi:putative ABC transport system permease protein
MFWHSKNERMNELNAEMQAHLDMATRDRIARGESPEDAARNARREFGDQTTVRESTSDMWSSDWPHQMVQEFKQAARSLARVPVFSLAAVLTLALGIGANTAIFSVINGVVLRPLPFAKPNQLVYITSQFSKMNLDHFPLDGAEFIELRERNRSFKEVGAYAVGAVNVGADESPRRVTSAIASASLFTAMAVPPLAGRTFHEDETLPNGPSVAVISRDLWRTAFGGRSIVGQQIQVDGVARTVIGVMPSGFDVHDEGVQIWTPLVLDPANRNQLRGGHFLTLVARLKDDVPLARAKSDLEAMLAQWNVLDGGNGKPPSECCGNGYVHTPHPQEHRLRYDNLQADIVGGIGRTLWILQAAVGFVLLIACANLANLLLIRAEGRHKELALRAALGAGRGRLIRQFVAESLVLSIAGAVGGIALARIGLKVFVAAGSSSIPRAAAVGIDGRVLAFTLLVAIGTGILFGLTPALHLSVGNLGLTLREAGSRTTAVGARRRMRSALVVGEMALAVTLVIGAGLLLKSFWNLMSVDAGFDRSHLTTFRVALSPRVYTDSMRRVAFFDNVTRQLATVPGVRSAAGMSGLPPQRFINANTTFIEGYEAKPGEQKMPNIDYYQYATPNYFTTMRIPIVAGRGFGPQDGPLSPPVMVINESMAKRYFETVSPVGRRVRPGGPGSTMFTIIGVAKDVKQGGVGSKAGTELYMDYEQMPQYAGFAPAAMYVVVRADLDKAALAPSIRKVVAGLDATIPIVQLRSMDEVFGDSVSQPHFIAQLLAVFALVAVVLSAVGTYGVVAYSITERVREIGIRMALGASADRVLGMVLRQGLTLGVVGVVIGLAGAALITRLMGALLFGVKPIDVGTFAAVAGLMLFVAGVAAYGPARRATKVDPLTALRAE